MTTFFRRLATSSAFAVLFIYAMVLSITPACIVQIGKHYQLSTTQLGYYFLALMGGFMLFVVGAGRYADRYGKLRPIFAGCISMAAGAFIFARADSFNITLLATFLMGAGGGLAEGTAMALVADLYTGRGATFMLNCSQAVFGLGAVSAPVAIGLLLKANMDWRVGFYATSISAVVVGCIILWALVMNQEKPVAHHEEHVKWSKLISNPFVILLCAAIMAYVGAELGQANWLAEYFKKNLHALRYIAAISVACFWGGQVVGRFIGAAVSKKVSDVRLVLISHICAMACQITLLLIGLPIPGLIFAFLLGVCLGPIFPTIVAFSGREYPKQSGTIFATVVWFGSLGGGIFPLSIGKLATVFGSLNYALWLTVGLHVINICIFSGLLKKERLGKAQ